MTIAKFRNIELLIFTIIAAVIDFVIGRYGLFGLRMYFAISYPIIVLMYIRWRKWGLAANGFIAIIHIFIYLDNPFLVILAHIISIMTISVMLLIEPKIRNKTFRFNVIALCFLGVYLLIALSEWVLLTAFSQNVAFWTHIINHSVNFLLGLLILFIMHLQKDLVIDMKTYFIEKNNKGN